MDPLKILDLSRMDLVKIILKLSFWDVSCKNYFEIIFMGHTLKIFLQINL